MIYQIIETTDKNGAHCNDSDSNNNSSGNINNINDTNFMLVMKIDKKETLHYVILLQSGTTFITKKSSFRMLSKTGQVFLNFAAVLLFLQSGKLLS